MFSECMWAMIHVMCHRYVVCIVLNVDMYLNPVKTHRYHVF
jgi:hypothetical protein